MAGVFYTAFGLWAFFSPSSFYDSIATYPPYNEHLFHDIGAFQLGFGALAFAALKWKDALTIVLAGLAVGSVAHAAAHWIDRDLGGKSTDPWMLSAFALAIVAGAILRARETDQ